MRRVDRREKEKRNKDKNMLIQKTIKSKDKIMFHTPVEN